MHNIKTRIISGITAFALFLPISLISDMGKIDAFAEEVDASYHFESSNGEKIYMQDYFSSEYSSGYIINKAPAAYGSGMTVGTAGGYVEDCIYSNNRSRDENCYVDYYDTFMYNGTYYDMRIYTWIASEEVDGLDEWYGISQSEPTIMAYRTYATADPLQHTAIEFHFYESGTLATNSPVEVSVKGVFRGTDMDIDEGYQFIQGANDIYLTSPTLVEYKGDNTWLGTISVSGDEHARVYAAFTSTPSAPFTIHYIMKYTYVSSFYYKGTAINYTLIDNNQNDLPSSASAPSNTYAAQYSYYNLIDADEIEHYAFSGWCTDSTLAVPAADTITVEDTAITLYGTYYKDEGYIETSVTNGTITSSAWVDYGDSQTVIYVPDTGYELSSIVIDGLVADITEYPSSYTFSNISDDHTISVVYSKINYTIDTSVTNGTITDDQTVAYNDSATISYTPDTGYELSSLTVDNQSVDTTLYPSSYTFNNVSANHTVNAVYNKISYTITTSASNGSITDNQTVEYGDTYTIYYTPDTGYNLYSVTVDDTPIGISLYPDSYTFTDISDNHIISVIYSKIPFTITTSATNGSITGNQVVEYGDSFTIYYTPDEGYELLSLTIDDTPVDISLYPSSYAFNDISDNHTIDAVFTKTYYNTPTISATSPETIVYTQDCNNTATVNDADITDILIVCLFLWAWIMITYLI